MSVAPNASGETYTTQGGLISQVFISSAGYVGSMAFGALLLALIRKAVAARIVLLACGIYVFALTMIFGFIKPVFWFDVVVRNSVHGLRGITNRGRARSNCQICQCTSGNFLCEFSRGAVRAQCTLTI